MYDLSMWIKFLNFLGLSRHVSFEDRLELGVNNSINKYYDTYKWLEKYDKETKSEPKLLADVEGLRNYFREVQGQDTIRRTNTPL